MTMIDAEGLAAALAAWKTRFAAGMVHFDTPYFEALREGKPEHEAKTIGAHALLDAFAATLIVEPNPELEPPAFVRGGKRLNFTRWEPYHPRSDKLNDGFVGEGDDEGCVPSCSWEELCALARLVVNHPAYRLPLAESPHYPAMIEDPPEPA